MAVFKCKMCGGELDLQQGMNIVECSYCGTKQTVPTLDDKLIRLYNRANQYRLDSEFDKAYSAYEAIISEKNDEAEAYWGMVLSEFGVEYVEDPENKKRIPTCHRTLVKSISTNENYKSALSFADVERQAMYEDEAEVIDSLQKKILNASAKEEPYDVFICYKETDPEGNRTEDSVLAQEIYDDLTNKGYRVFFSRITLEDKLGKDYEPCIYAALTSAKVMLVVTTDSDNCNAVWVKNEWKRYIDFMKTDKDKTLIPVYKNMSPYALPDEFAKLQAQDMSKIGAIQDLVRGIEKLVGKTDNSKSGLSEDEKKLLNAFEKSQARKKNLIKLVVCSAIGVALLAVLCALSVLVFPELSEIRLLKGPSSIGFESAIRFLLFLAGGTMYLTTAVSMFMFGKKSFKYSKYSFVFLFICFSGWLLAEGMINYTPTDILWLGYVIVGFSAALSTIIDAIINKKIPFLLLVVILCALGLFGFEKTVPQSSNGRDSSVEQIIIINDYINIRYEAGATGYSTAGAVSKGDIYTVLDTEFVDGSKWIKIRTGLDTEGYIIFGEGDEPYCEYLPVDEEIQDEINAKREKEEADIKKAKDAIVTLNGMWKWQNFDGYYMEIKDGVISYGTNPDKTVDSIYEFWQEGIATVEYDVEKDCYTVNCLVVYADAPTKLTYDGTEIRMYNYLDAAPEFFGGYAVRYNP